MPSALHEASTPLDLTLAPSSWDARRAAPPSTKRHECTDCVCPSITRRVLPARRSHSRTSDPVPSNPLLHVRNCVPSAETAQHIGMFTCPSRRCATFSERASQTRRDKSSLACKTAFSPGIQLMQVTRFCAVLSSRTCWDVLRSHRRIVLSREPVQSRDSSSGSGARPVTTRRWPSRVARAAASPGAQSFTVASRDPESAWRDRGSHPTRLTAFACPPHTCAVAPVFQFQSTTSPAALPATSWLRDASQTACAAPRSAGGRTRGSRGDTSIRSVARSFGSAPAPAPAGAPRAARPHTFPIAPPPAPPLAHPFGFPSK